MQGKSIDELRSLLDEKKVASDELFEEATKLAKANQVPYNAFVTILDKKEEVDNKTILSGIPYALKDNISTKDILTTGSSNILKDYIPVYNATVYEKLKQAGAVLVGKNTLDELAMGGTGTTGHTGIVRNPWNADYLIGGSSAGSAAAVALGIVPFAIGSDTGDSVRKPAAFGGIVGFKPTYGRISRYGLFSFASSLDHVGIMARNVKDIAYVTDIVKGQDIKDMTSLPDDFKLYQETLTSSIQGKKLFYIKSLCDIENYQNPSPILKEVLTQFKQQLDGFKKLGFVIEGVDFDEDLLSALYPTYMTISCAEATSNNANLSGIGFGSRKAGKGVNDIMFQTRTEGFSELIKRRFILGSYILKRENQERLFLNALRIRRLIVDKMNELFETYDGLIMPASGGIAKKVGTVSEQVTDSEQALENHMVIGNFGGYPSITIPSGFVDDMPIGINLTGRVKADAEVLNMAYHLEESMTYKNQFVGGKHV